MPGLPHTAGGGGGGAAGGTAPRAGAAGVQPGGAHCMPSAVSQPSNSSDLFRNNPSTWR